MKTSETKRIVGSGLLWIGCYMLVSSIMYALGGSAAWFSRLSLGVMALGLWYAGTPDRRPVDSQEGGR